MTINNFYLKTNGDWLSLGAADEDTVVCKFELF